jgi:hypothetical protein
MRSSAVFTAPAVVAVLGVVAFNHALTGTLLPISATVKAGLRANAAGHSALLLGIAIAGLAAGAAVFGLRHSTGNVMTSGLLLIGLGASLWISADLIAVGRLEAWNRVPVLLLGMIGAAYVSSMWRAPIVLACVVAVAFARWPLAFARGPVSPAAYGPYRWAAGEWLRDHLGPDERAGSWNAGTIGYVSDRHVVNLDGLVNDRAYRDEVIRGRRLEGYLDREGIAWIADQACGPDPTLAPYLARTGSSALALRAELVASFHDPASPDGCPGVAVWRLRKK